MLNCPSCGKSSPESSDYCIYCGGALSQPQPPGSYAYQQPSYTPQTPYTPPQPAPAPYVQSYAPYRQDETVTMGEWFVFFLVMAIPLVNVIMLFVWAFGSGTKPSKANLCKLQLLLYAIAIIIIVIIGLAVGWAVFDIFGRIW